MSPQRFGRITWGNMGRRNSARQLAADYAGLVSVAQAKQVLAILSDDSDAARWCCEVVKQATERRLFADPINPVSLARSLAARRGWEPTLKVPS